MVNAKEVIYAELNGVTEDDIASNDMDIILNCLVKILRPPSPQPAQKQITFLCKYIHLLNRHRFNNVSSPAVCIDWFHPFINVQQIVTFPGHGLSNMVYGIAKLYTSIAKFSDDATCSVHPVYPSNGIHHRVWDELLDCFKSEFPQCSSPSPLFYSQHTENREISALAHLEPFTVRLKLQNPFPFPLILRNLHLSINKFKTNNSTETQMDFNQYLELSSQNIELPAISNEPIDWHLDDWDNQNYLTSLITSIDLCALPKADVQSFEINGIRFQLCAPSQEEENSIFASVETFVPIQIPGKKLFKTKEERMSNQYSTDCRLQVAVQQKPSPLLAFRFAGGDANLMHAMTQNLLIDAYADQILQIVFEVENVGTVPVHEMAVCSNWPEQVSISETNIVVNTEHWSDCPVSLRESLFANEPYPPEPEFEGAAKLGIFKSQFIGAKRPLVPGQKTAIRIALRAWPESQVEENCQYFYFLIFYSDENGQQSRQFRYAFRLRCMQSLLTASLRSLNPAIGLNMINLKGTPSVLTSTFAKIELLRLSAVFCTSGELESTIRNDGQQQGGGIKQGQQHGLQKGMAKIFWKSGCTLRTLMNKQVTFENDQSLSTCFFVAPDSSQQFIDQITPAATGIIWNDLWLCQPEIPDIPIWHLALSINEPYKHCREEKKQPILLLRLLWKASLTRNDGTIGIIFGETLLSSDEEEEREVETIKT